MTRPHYEGTANHALRFYFRHLTADVNEMPRASFVDWRVCNEILENYSAQDFAILRAVYQYRDASVRDLPMQDIVGRVSAERNVHPRCVWRLLHRTARAYAKGRGLI